MNEESLFFMVDLQKKLTTLYDSHELETLCFILGLDYDSLRGGAKQTKVNSLISYMARHGRLPALIEQTREDRSHVDWPDPPPNFQLPQMTEGDGPGSTYIVDTGGGSFVQGSVATGGGVFSGRDAQVGGDAIAGSHYELEGDFSGSVVSLNSRLENATQSVAAMPHGTVEQQEELTQLIGELNRLLSEVPAEQSADADAIARRVEVLADEARNIHPDRDLIEEIGESARRVAGRLKPWVPRLLPLVGAILELVRFMIKL